MDKSWMHPTVGKCSSLYVQGCKRFLQFAWENRPQAYGDRIFCPCTRCVNNVLHPLGVVGKHLSDRGIMRSYTNWTEHGEAKEGTGVQESNDIVSMREMLQDGLGFPDLVGISNDTTSNHNQPDDPRLSDPIYEDPNEEAQKFYRLLKEAETPLFPDCNKSSKLSFLVRLLHVKCLNGWSNTSFDMMLQVLKDSFPDETNMPKNHYESKKQLRDLDKKRDETKDKCDICGESRWIKTPDESVEERAQSSTKYKKKPAKVLRYFPLKPRLQRLFMCSKTAKDMRWHADVRAKDDALRHPADSRAWEHLDETYPLFGLEPRNVRLGLASDGFNPFGIISTNHSTWPVVLIPYNLPPWMCMKQPYFIVSLLIPGPSSPGNNIDIYLRPLVDELNDLWADRVETYDANSKKNFRMRAAVIWTVSDYPTKFCFLGARQFLQRNHIFRRSKSAFDNSFELRDAPIPLSGEDILAELSKYGQITFGKEELDAAGQKRKRDDNKLPHNWKKISIFFELPYWKDLLLRHNLDIMHIEKNNAESWLGTLLNIDGKTKDSLKARKDLVLMGIRKSLHPIAKGNNKYDLPPARYTMSLQEKRKLCQFLKDIKVPDNYSSNISRRVQVKECKIIGLKSHDWHVLMQQLLPVAARGILPKEVTLILVEISNFFRQLCSKVLFIKDLENLEYQIALTLCKMEMIFTPAFFDIMVHLPIHLAGEAKVAGPVPYRWMYFVERYLYTLKKYVRNKSRPEGSIAEGYLADECLTFCSRYLDGSVETKFNRPGRNDNSEDDTSTRKLPIFVESGRALGKGTLHDLADCEWDQARLYVLHNCDKVAPFVEMHTQIIRDNHGGRISPRNVDLFHNEKFGSWFENHVQEMKRDGELVSKQIVSLSLGLARHVSSFKGFIVNGFRFHTKEHEVRRKTQNSGVFVSAKTSSFASARDINPVTGNVGYYGVLKDIIELHYVGGNFIYLFKCDWWDVMTRAGMRNDDYGFTTINITRTLAASEPFILSSQAQQVFYLKDNLDDNRRVVLKTQPRDLYDMGSEVEPIQENSSYMHQDVSFLNDNIELIRNWTREEIGNTEVSADIPLSHGNIIVDDEDGLGWNYDSDDDEEFSDEDNII